MTIGYTIPYWAQVTLSGLILIAVLFIFIWMLAKNTTSGIYSIWAGNRCVYVGKSSNLLKRWAQHKSLVERKIHWINEFNLFHTKELSFRVEKYCRGKKMNTLEKEYIKALEPIFNSKLVEKN